ncbi:unnamed protein product, partial [Mesorhabditis belari]|uniref:EF-hand domain-containing protein n=1 Tax=Mesorhabditis belari TaxID=2138241 RepID=A0AAF3JA88_9BILA
MLPVRLKRYGWYNQMCVVKLYEGRGSMLLGIRASSSTAPQTTENVNPIEKYTAFGGLRKPKKSVWHYTDRVAGKGYSDFSNTIYNTRPYIWPPLRKLNKINAILVGLGMLFLLIDFERFTQALEEILSTSLTKASPEAKQVQNGEDKEEEHLHEPLLSEASTSIEKKKYEDRIRNYSTPDKVFRYFATLKVVNESGQYEVFMTPEDFVRSFTPGVMQPRKYCLDRFKVYDPEKYRHNFSDPSSIFYKLGESGLISYSDYLFLKTLLSTSPKDFELAFRIFDINGDGALDKEEFYKIQSLVMSQTSIGQRHRDHITPGLSFRVQTNSALESYFFGKDGSQKLSAEKFLEFQADLHRDILKMEFERRDLLDGQDGIISEKSFGELLLLHAHIDEKQTKTMLKRVKKQYKGSQGITFDEVMALFALLYHIEEVDVALHFHRMAGVSIDGEMLQRVAKKITGIDLSNHVVEVVITLFDDNLDGKLSDKEFISVMRRRMRRGLDHPGDTGVFRFGQAVIECSKRALFDSPLPLYQLKH